MPATPFDSALYKGLFHDAELAALFTDSAEIRAMLVVEGALAWAQAGVGMIPAEQAEAIHKGGFEITLDAAALAGPTGQNGVSVPGLVAAFRTALGDDEAAQYVHWGATSQDISDSAQALRLRKACDVYEDRLKELAISLRSLARSHRDTPMAARTWGMAATPTSFGAVVASWGHPLLGALASLPAVRKSIAQVSLSGASGTNAAMGIDGAEVRAQLAGLLGLADPGTSTHSTRQHIAGLGAWITLTAGALAKLAEDILSLTRAGEVTLRGSGGSSTMPQKQNPVAPSTLLALARTTAALNTALQGAAAHRDQRDGAAWMTEWLTLPQMCLALGRMLELAQQIIDAVEAQPDQMAQNLDENGLGLIYAEALQFALARQMPRPEAQAQVKELCLDARGTGTPLPKLAARQWPQTDFGDLFTPQAQLGDAPAEADSFGQAVLAAT
ncbi:adenylosuccinate lyase family protein [Alphaproteobacteria bacterium KMM 3653]|uniref:Adenylosuccinate lyase family protein n=1 Tax=Harenicola maris TaxID=2841044 RepID=A0AAP2CQL9_9RHOB|nr:adenylosuccinate lyase family protein [Harenicola maris]